MGDALQDHFVRAEIVSDNPTAFTPSLEITRNELTRDRISSWRRTARKVLTIQGT